MSYEIMYNWQFLRSAEGLTPVVLMGSSNVTEASWSRANRRTERRARDWFCLFNMLGVTDDEFLAQIKSMTGGEYQEHWKQNGKWVNDATLVRWGQQNVKNAASIEDVLQLNRPFFLSAECYISLWPKPGEDGWSKQVLSRAIHTTEELDNWIREARQVIAKAKSEKRSVYPIVRFSKENFMRYKPLPETIVLKKGQKSFVQNIEVRDGRNYVSGVSYTQEIQKAKKFKREEYFELLSNYQCALLNDVRPVSAEAVEFPYDAVVMVTVKKDGSHKFIYSASGTNVRITPILKGAHKFKNLYAAQQTAKRLARRFDSTVYEFEAFSLSHMASF